MEVALSACFSVSDALILRTMHRGGQQRGDGGGGEGVAGGDGQVELDAVLEAHGVLRGLQALAAQSQNR